MASDADIDFLRYVCAGTPASRRFMDIANRLARLENENADLREELAAMRDSHRALDPVELMALDMRSGADLVITVHDETHLEEVRQAAGQYANVLQMRGLDCNIFIAPPGVEVTTRAACKPACDCDSPPMLECTFETFNGTTCGHCGQPDCLPHAENCPALGRVAENPLWLTAYCRAEQIYIAEDGSEWPKDWVHAHSHLFNFADGVACGDVIAPAPGKDHTVRAVIEDGKIIATGPCCDGKCTNAGETIESETVTNAPGYCPACGGSGGHRIGCPNK